MAVENEIAASLRLLAERIEGGAYGSSEKDSLDTLLIENDLDEIIFELPE
jgi:hypothetical protein